MEASLRGLKNFPTLDEFLGVTSEIEGAFDSELDKKYEDFAQKRLEEMKRGR